MDHGQTARITLIIQLTPAVKALGQCYYSVHIHHSVLVRNIILKYQNQNDHYVWVTGLSYAGCLTTKRDDNFVNELDKCQNVVNIGLWKTI